MSFNTVKQKINNLILLLIDLLIYMACHVNSPKLCSYLIKISLLNFNSLKINKKENKTKNKIIILLYRSIGIRDVEIISKLSDQIPKILILRRRIIKIILNYFFYRKKNYFNFFKTKPTQKEFFKQKKKDKKDHEDFWAEILLNLNKYMGNKEINFITFAYYYYVEEGLYAACKRVNIPVKLWNKECFMSDPDVNLRIKQNQYKTFFKYFKKISVYNKFMKKMLIRMDRSNEKKTIVSGCPRVFDFVKKKKYKKVKNLLFLSFNPKQGFPKDNQFKNLNWNLTYSKIINVLNELVDNENLNISIKRKNINAYKPVIEIDKRIKIYEGGTAEKYINEADIIIGHNSGSTIESLVSGKFVMVPFFEKNKNLKRYLYKFDKSLIYTSEKKMKNEIINLTNKKFSFPIKNKKYLKSIEYYYGSKENIKENYINFINN